MKENGMTATLISENTWDVKSSTSDVFYSVYLCKEFCDCQLRCPSCGACVHMYVCSCVDHAVHYTVCKHTHLVHLQRTENSDKELLCMLNELDNNREVPD